MSTNQGITWQAQTLNATWDIRDSLMGVAYYSSQLEKTVVLHSGGHDDTNLNFRPNEVWASSDLGVTWTLFPRAPYVGRNHAAMRLSPNGVLVVVAGKTDEVGTNPLTGLPNNNLGLNDVWVSLTGGVSWSLCTGMAQFPPRQDLNAVLDNDGYLYVTGGINGLTGVDLADMWRSNISFHDIGAVGAACGVTPSPCGVGLRCWPQSGRAYECPCDFSLQGGDVPDISTLALTPLQNPYSPTNAASVLPNCAVPEQQLFPAPVQGYLCFITYSLPGNIDYPWSVATTVNFLYDPTLQTLPFGQAVTVLAGSGTRVYTNRFNNKLTTPFTVLASGLGFTHNLLYVGAPQPVDSNGLLFNTSAPIQQPGNGPAKSVQPGRHLQRGGLRR